MVIWRNSHSQLAMILIMAKSNATDEHLKIAIVAERSEGFIKGNSRHDNLTLDQPLLWASALLSKRFTRTLLGRGCSYGYAAWLASPRAFRDIVTSVQLHGMF